MPIKVYNSLTRTKVPFSPSEKGRVKMYVCGPTVYSLSHVGHARSAVCFDVIYRYLKYRGFEVTYARNYTDVDDKIINRAVELGIPPIELAEENIKKFDDDMAALGVALPDIRPRATETIEKIIEVTETLIKKGFAYAIDGDVYFEVRCLADYGKLSGKNIDDLESGARVEVDDRKKDPLDFALWKKSKPGEPSWESPWGPGRPGWHIECSAMCMKWLGDTIDIHGGGKDLIFPHHENEIAQSEAATGKKPFVKYWLHNGFVNIDRTKMSKSLGNILNIRDVLKNHSSEAVRFFLLSSHYRSPIDYSGESIKEAEAAVERFYKTVERISAECPGVSTLTPDHSEVNSRMEPITAAMDDDFNTAEVIGALFKEVTRANRLIDEAKGAAPDEGSKKELALILAFFKETGSFLGIFTKGPEEYFNERKAGAGMAPEEIERLIEERNKAREKKDFQRADEIRAELLGNGVVLEDTPKGTVWSVKG